MPLRSSSAAIAPMLRVPRSTTSPVTTRTTFINGRASSMLATCVIQPIDIIKIAMQYDEGTEVDRKGIGRKVPEKVNDTYSVELENKDFAYDGEKSLFTVGQLPHKKLDFTVVLDDISSSRSRTNGGSGGSYSLEESQGNRKRVKQSFQSKTIKVQVNFAAKILMQAITNALRGQDSDHFKEAVRVLDIIIRQNAAKQGCLLVRQSFFHNNPRNFIELGGGVLGYRGFHSSFWATQGGLSLNMDVSTIMIVKPGPVLNFLMENQNVKTPYQIDWIKAKRMLKNLKVETYASKTEYKITGLSDKPCKQQTFFLKSKGGHDGDGEEITVYEYFAQHQHMQLRDSADFPCINVGKPKKPSYFPLELCNLVSLQRYTKALSNLQRASLVEKSRQKPQEQMSTLRDLGGINSLLMVEHPPSLPLVSKSPTLILGMDVSHGSLGRSDVPSIAVVVSSRKWPLISRYRAAIRT
ncbi:protein argonaute 4A [Rosa chinensis]|uniref:protein argonaute 4A n=1 Tax=Rosa chinensis TaxID=74649 RepID=UPI000D0890D1|nr:protein argonaute 4A [Rosa chinensis]